MQKFSSIIELKAAILQLEEKQTIELKLLKEEWVLSNEYLKPSNLIKNAFEDIKGPSGFIENIIGPLIGVFGGYLSKKIIAGKSSSVMQTIVANMIQMAVTEIIMKNSENIKSMFRGLINTFANRKEKTL